MDSFFIFLFKSCLWITAFWIVYRLFLRNETFHAFNRWFLIAGLSLSFVLPFLQFYYPKTIITTTSSLSPDWMLAITDQPAPLQPSSPLEWIHIAAAIYAVVALFQLARSLAEIHRINNLIAKYGYTQHQGYRLVELDLPVAPFSFRNYIFINRREVTDMEAGIIIAHESSHIRQRHWIDLVAGAGLRIVQWINPFAFLLVRGMRENHEFMADKAAIADGNPIAVYKAVLINSSLGGRVFTLGHPFSNTNNLKRYKMMNKKLSSASRKWSVLAILPLAALFFMAFAKPRYTIVEAAAPIVQETVAVAAQEVAAPIVRKTALPAIQEIDEAIEEVVVQQSAVDEPPVITLRAADSIVVKTGKDKTARTVFSRMQSAADSIRKNLIVINGRNTDSLTHPLFIVDDIEYSYESTLKLNPDWIKTITVLKDKSAITLYGDHGKNGVVVIQTIGNVGKDKDAGNKDIVEKIVTIRNKDNNAPDPVVIVDDQRINVAIMKSLSTESIESITVLKGKSAIALYGEDARNGVVVITLKKE